MADKDKLTPGSDPVVPGEDDFGDPAGEQLADERLADPEAYQVAPDEIEAEELEDLGEPVPNDGVDDPEQLTEAEQVAATARNTRPVRKTAAAGAPTKKGHATLKRSSAGVATAHRTTPAQFVRESAGELRKVVWPTADQLRQYFIVVLVFVLIVIAYVSALDLLFGWGLLKIFG